MCSISISRNVLLFLQSRFIGQNLQYVQVTNFCTFTWPSHSHYGDGGAELRYGTLDSGEVEMIERARGRVEIQTTPHSKMEWGVSIN